ncbi:carboxypeptidase regulatory-like domain-containing protein [bacterium]|nr:carboxypeptidase regulatory-like domain-containing protein [bacterium]
MAPIGEASVEADDFETGDWAAWAQTLPDGSYTIWVPSGTYSVNVFRVEGWCDQYYLNTPYWDEATPVSVSAPGETSGIDFVLQPAATIIGQVFQNDGVTPIPDAWVSAFDAASGSWVAGGDTEHDGSYSISVPSGSYKVRAEADGWASQYYDGVDNFDEASIIAVNVPEERGGIDFVLQRGATITGHVYEMGGVTPIAGASVGAVDATTGDWVAWDDTDQNGSYSISVPSGSYKVWADADGWVGEYYPGTYDFDQASTITLTAPEQRSGVNFALGLAATITGHVYEMGGVTPIAGASVGAVDATTGEWVTWDQTDAGGFYSISVPSGSYKVWAHADGWVGEYYPGTYDFDQASIITLTAPQQRTGIDFALLEASAAIKGHVYQQDGVTPVAGGSVGATDDATGLWMAWAQTEDDGSYTLRVAPGTYRLDAGGLRWNWQQYATPVTVGDSQVIENIDFSLEYRPLTIQVLRWSTIWTGGLELHWEGQSGASYRIFWSTGSLGNGMTWHEVPNAQDDIRQEGDTMIWTDRGTAPGMDGSRPGDPNARQRFYKVKEESE